MKKTTFFTGIILFLFALMSCKKEERIVPVSVPSYEEVPTVLIENYINRIYIDLLGREPLDSEMTKETAYLRANKLSKSSRVALAHHLQSDTSFKENEISYRYTYYHQLYNKCKARMIEGASAYEIQFEINLINADIARDSATENYEAIALKLYERQKLQDVIDAEHLYRQDSISLGQVLGRMANNKIYDIINMNTFNFVRASFDNLFFRFPTDPEFHTCFDIVEYNQAKLLWGKPAQNRKELIDLWVNSNEYLNGQVIWTYQGLLARYPNSKEMAEGMTLLYNGGSQQELEQQIIATDEYAHFTYIN